jgi:hypothetical protein
MSEEAQKPAEVLPDEIVGNYRLEVPLAYIENHWPRHIWQSATRNQPFDPRKSIGG